LAIVNPMPTLAGSLVAPAANTEQERLVAERAGLVVTGAEPLNCETPASALGGEVTPTAQFYRRNHFSVPVLDAATWRLAVSGMVDRPQSLSLHELRKLPAETAVVTLECAGNGRSQFRPPTQGVQWTVGAVGTAEWTGARLADVLRAAGIIPGALEVIFGGADRGRVDGSRRSIPFERSLTVADALECGALLAYEMNGRPLPARHGYPVRLVVPGWYAVASVKWLTDIRVVDKPFDGFFQAAQYVYDRNRGATAFSEPVRLQQVRALITRPASGQRLSGGALGVRGVAWSGAAPIERVEVSVAAGPWQKARLVGMAPPSSWQQWEFLATGLEPGEVSLRARASDLAGNVQPERPEWNRLGYGGNFVHDVRVLLR
jgi:DMSO/TMAO reductase YedYZ molybdopterin-dependent catalytic subunit